MTDIEDLQEKALARAVARLRSGLLATVFAMTWGASLWITTVWLVIRGGSEVGKHLGLLRFYFPGYSVTWGGAFIGSVYAAVAGAVVGFLVGWLYNRLADWRGN